MESLSRMHLVLPQFLVYCSSHKHFGHLNFEQASPCSVSCVGNPLTDLDLGTPSVHFFYQFYIHEHHSARCQAMPYIMVLSQGWGRGRQQTPGFVYWKMSLLCISHKGPFICQHILDWLVTPHQCLPQFLRDSVLVTFHCCDQSTWLKQIKAGRIHLGSQFHRLSWQKAGPMSLGKHDGWRSTWQRKFATSCGTGIRASNRKGWRIIY